MKKIWTDRDVAFVVGVLQKTPITEYRGALGRIGTKMGFQVTSDTLRHLFRNRHLPCPTSYCQAVDVVAPVSRRVAREPAAKVSDYVSAARSKEAAPEDQFATLMQLVRKKVDFATLCDKLDMAPGKARSLIEQARDAGYRVNVAGDHVGWKEPDEVSQSDWTERVPPVIGDTRMVAVISDTHFGSKYCMRAEIRDFITGAYKMGVREILHCGDMLDGCYDHGRWELSHHGFDAQVDDALETLPALKGLTYHFITGNHDETFSKSTGLDCGRAIVDRAHAAGRHDLYYYGARGAVVRVAGALVELWHPKKSRTGVYALSHPIQTHIRDYAPGTKPDILLVGHWHVSAYVPQRGVHGCAVPCFQSPGSSFSRSLGGSPAMGGLILSWQNTEHGTLRWFDVKHGCYYVDEQPRRLQVESEMPAPMAKRAR